MSPPPRPARTAGEPAADPHAGDPATAPLHDWHLSASGYLESPRDGTLDDVLDRVAALSGARDVVSARRLGAPPEQRGLSAALDGLTGEQWAPSVLDGRLSGFRTTRLCRAAGDVDRALDAAALEGAAWVLLGDALAPGLAVRAVLGARDRGLRVAAEPGAATPEALATGGVSTIEGLVGLLVAPELRTAPPWDQVFALADDDGAWRERLRPVLEAGAGVVPLLIRHRRRSLLHEAVGGAGIAELSDVLPYHRHLAGMRNPGAMRFGKKHAGDHLGLPTMDRAERARFGVGWRAVPEAMALLAASGVPLLGGSGAPSLGVCPGVGLLEERRAWTAAELPDDLVATAFSPRALEHREVPA